MNIQIALPVGFSKIGGRSNNEDSIYPLENDATEKTKLFVVCDGMGGHSNGEIASRLTSRGFAEHLSKNPQANTPNHSSEIYAIWDEALKNVEIEFEDHVKQHPESKGMGTTLCFCHFHTLGVTLGHVGDSRIYQVRGNNIIFKSEDHSMVNELLRSNQITEEEAATHSQKNVITRAIQGSKSPTKIEYDIRTDVQPGDFIFMCTDGVLEQINDRILEAILSQDGETVQQRIDSIIDKCENATKDNFSGYLIEISGVEGVSSIYDEVSPIYEIPQNEEENIVSQTPLNEPDVNIKHLNLPTTPAPQKKLFSKTKDILVGLAYGLGGLLLAFFGWIAYSSIVNPKEEKPSNATPAKITKPKIENTPIEKEEHTRPQNQPNTKPPNTIIPKTSKKSEKEKPKVVTSKPYDKKTNTNSGAPSVNPDVLENLKKQKQQEKPPVKEEGKKPKDRDLKIDRENQ